MSSSTRFAVFNPATGEQIGSAPDGGADEALAAIDAACEAFPAWSASGAYERSAKLYRAHELMMAKRDELARLMTAEQGKPLKMAYAEVKYAADFLLWFAEEAKRVYGETIP
ncbi:MAG: aldehyde dehydrogenase family protein, partial [Gammaproteobacteria bacterium]|nr:aldehyde dehydrogenase family protein [Gammaproteobacteria bacterium]